MSAEDVLQRAPTQNSNTANSDQSRLTRLHYPRRCSTLDPSWSTWCFSYEMLLEKVGSSPRLSTRHSLQQHRRQAYRVQHGVCRNGSRSSCALESFGERVAVSDPRNSNGVRHRRSTAANSVQHARVTAPCTRCSSYTHCM